MDGRTDLPRMIEDLEMIVAFRVARLSGPELEKRVEAATALFAKERVAEQIQEPDPPMLGSSSNKREGSHLSWP